MIGRPVSAGARARRIPRHRLPPSRPAALPGCRVPQHGHPGPETSPSCEQADQAERKGNPGTRDRDIALAMAVGFEERNRRLAGKPMVLTAIFELLSSDRNWRLLD